MAQPAALNALWEAEPDELAYLPVQLEGRYLPGRNLLRSCTRQRRWTAKASRYSQIEDANGDFFLMVTLITLAIAQIQRGICTGILRAMYSQPCLKPISFAQPTQR